MENGNRKGMKSVFTVTENKGKSHWVRIGAGFVNSDGSMNLRLDALPVNGTIQVREWEDEEAWRARRAASANGASHASTPPPLG
jgi:hypothetical protein